MPHRTRFYLAAALITFLAFEVYTAPAEQGALNKDKRDRVLATFENLPSTLPDAVLQDALDRALAFVGFQADTSDTRSTLTLEVSGEPSYHVYFAAPQTLILDLYNTVPVPDFKKLVISGGTLVAQAGVHLLQAEPMFLTRVKVELSRPVTYAVDASQRAITLVIVPRTQDAGSVDAVATEFHRALERQNASIHAARLAHEEIIARSDAAARSLSQTLAQRLEAGEALLDELKISKIENDLLSLAVAGVNNTPDYLSESAANLAKLTQDIHAAQSGREYERSRIRTVLDTNISTFQSRIASQRKAVASLLAGETSAQDALDSLNRLLTSGQRALATDQRLYESLQHQLRHNEETAHSRLEGLSEALEEATLRMEHSWAPQALHDGNRGLFDRLDAAFAQLRDQPTDNLDAFSTAMAAVSATEISIHTDLPLHTAALDGQRTIASLSSDRPPLPRRRPAAHSLTAAVNPPLQKWVMLTGPPDGQLGGQSNEIMLLAQNQDPIVVDAEDAAQETANQAPLNAQEILSLKRASKPSFNLYRRGVSAEEDPLQQLVNIDFRQMDLTNVVTLLAQKAQINVIAGAEVSGTVTANLQNIPLGRAIEIVLRLNGLGIIEEEGVYRITRYAEAVASRRQTKMIFLRNATANEVKETLGDVIAGSPDAGLVSISANKSTNVLILAGPSDLVEDFEDLIASLDVAEPVIPTITAAIKLNYSDPNEIESIVQKLLSDAGKVSVDLRSRHLIITDLPVKVEEIRRLIKIVDTPVKQVSIEAMIVDAIMSDKGETGIDFVVNALRRQNSRGETVGNLQSLGGESDFTTGGVKAGSVNPLNLGGQIAFSILSGDIDFRGAIGAEIQSGNAEILANPLIVTVENQLARISISEEIPFQELTQSTTGPPIASTEFKQVGTILEVTPRVTHDNHIIISLLARQSDTKGESVTGVPIEDLREAQTTLRLRDGQTIFIGGLRRFDDETTVRKVPILGDIPILNLLFRNQSVVKEHLELLIFLTCHILPDDPPELTPALKMRFDKLGGITLPPDATRALLRPIIHPEDMRDPFWKWRRKK